MKKRTDEEFKNIMADMFGKEYICEETKYVNNVTPVILLCPKHGLFKRIPTDLTKGKGCQKCSYENLSKERTRWDKNGAIEISKKYSNRSSFKKGDYSAYKLCLNNGWFDEMPWMLPQDKWNKNNYVYAYIDEKNKVAYVGLTCNKQEREWSHRHKSNSSVYKYFTSINCDIPRPIYLEKNLSKVDAQIKEDEWRTIFIKRGYVMLNIGKTGKGVGSIGGNLKKWSKNKVFEESKKYKTRTEFKKSCSRAYNVALKNKWLDEMTWLIPLRLNTKNITREEVFLKAKEFMYKSHFRKNANTYFRIAEKNDWLKEMTWFKKPNRNYQTNNEKVKKKSDTRIN